MTRGPIGDLIDHARFRAAAEARLEDTDRQLLDRFVDRRDEAAFASLVRRHGPVVWAICRRVLARHHDAEDAFQATFLVLARKPQTVCPRENVGGWLCGVAYRAAWKARAAARRRREVTGGPPVEPPAPTEPAGADLRPLLERELARLPDRYRAVIVLCDLQGLTRKEAAARLGIPEGTVAGWQARGRARMAARLARSGVAPAVGLLLTQLAGEAAAEPPAGVALATFRATAPTATGEAAASPDVAALTDGVLRDMLLTKLKSVLAPLAVCAAVLAAGTWLLAPSPGGGNASAWARQPAPLEPAAAVNDQPPVKKDDPPAAKPAPKPEPRGDWADLKGRWDLVSAEVNGKKAVPAGKKPEADPKKGGKEEKDSPAELPFNNLEILPPTPGGEGTSSVGWLIYYKDLGLFQEWPVDTLDPDSKPKGLHAQGRWVNVLKPDWEGFCFFGGIYKLDGDTLTLCFSWGDLKGDKRPKEFTAAAGTGNSLFTFKRRPEKKDP